MSANLAAPPWEGRPYSIARDGVSITNCESEPVRTPGCIQDHGAVLVVGADDLVVLQASANTGARLGAAPETLLGAPIGAAIGEAGEARLRALVEAGAVDGHPLYALTLPARGGDAPLDAVVHAVDGALVVELEPGGRDRAENPDYYAAVRRAVHRLQGARTVAGFCDDLAEQMRALTGLDRVMVYRFHPDFHGEVVAESKREDLGSWLGLHYPAGDIPVQVRELFTRLWIRPLSDVSGTPVEMVPLANPRTGAPLDMTHCALRGASVMYTEYLANMGVAATLTMPLLRDGELWGLIACHHCTPTAFAWEVRAAAEFLAQVASLQLRSVEERESLVQRLEIESVHSRLVARAAREGDLAALVGGEPSLVDGMDARGAALRHAGTWYRTGDAPPVAELDALADWLAARPELDPGLPGAVFATDSLASLHPGADALGSGTCGLLALPLGRIDQGLILWFRPETLATVNWAGESGHARIVPGPNGPRLTPRASFELFAESVRDRSLPWHDAQVDAARRLRQLLLELVVVRAEEVAELNVELARSNDELDAFAYVASHDLKEPLRGISKYAHQLLDEAGDVSPERRAKLEALMRLTARMDGLLDSLLHFSRVGRASLDMADEDLNEIVEEAIEITATRGDPDTTEIAVPRPLPTVRCDRVRVREIYVNLVSNALKYNDSAVRRVELGHALPGEQDAATRSLGGGATVFHVRDNGIGIAAQHHDALFEMFRRLHGRDAYGGGTGTGTAIVRRLVERHEGRVWLESEPGAGTTFRFTLDAGGPER